VNLAQAAEIAGVAFDLVVLDEAHRTAGPRDREFVTLLHDDKVKTRRRLFMTATERKIRNSNGDSEIDVLFSMDENVEDYGPRFYTMSFKEAIERGIITDYRIVTYFVKESEIEELIKGNRLLNLDEGLDPVAARDVATAVSTKRVMEHYGVKHPLVFHRSISASKAFRHQQDLLNGFEIGPVSENFHVDSSMSAGEREEWLERFIKSPVAVMSNARCLTEGVDVPGIDAVVFAAPKQSTVDIVQASGRALRRAKDKEFGYIVIPIIVPDDMPFDAFAETTQFKTIIKILVALSTQDDRIVETLRARFYGPNPKGGKRRERIIKIGGEVPVGFRILLDEFAFYIETRVWENIGLVNKRSYEEARSFAREQGIKNAKQYTEWARTDKRPADIPASPDQYYQGNGWTNWGDFLESGSYRGDAFRSYDETRDAVRAKGIRNQDEFRVWAKSGEKPDDIPASPDRFYRGKGWTNWGDFLGVYYRYELRSYDETREFVRTRGFKTKNEFSAWATSGDKPNDIPSNPQRVYKNKGWTSWGDFLGTDNHRREEAWPFDETRDFVRERGFTTIEQFQAWARSLDRPRGIPSNPNRTYAGKGWTNWGDFLGTGKNPTARARESDK
jgi:hypothetical protein